MQIEKTKTIKITVGYEVETGELILSASGNGDLFPIQQHRVPFAVTRITKEEYATDVKEHVMRLIDTVL